jgi:hypothetical protein
MSQNNIHSSVDDQPVAFSAVLSIDKRSVALNARVSSSKISRKENDKKNLNCAYSIKFIICSTPRLTPLLHKPYTCIMAFSSLVIQYRAFK